MNVSGIVERLRADRVTISDLLAFGVTASLPWSSSITSVLLVLFLLAFLSRIGLAECGPELMRPALGLPVLLALLAIAGIAWSIAPLHESLRGLEGFSKLLYIPILAIYFRNNYKSGVIAIIVGVLSCFILMGLSSFSVIWPDGPWAWMKAPGVPVKDYIAQSNFFCLMAFGLAHCAMWYWNASKPAAALWLAGAAVLFLANIAMVYTSRTALFVLPFLVLLFALQHMRRGGLLIAGALVLVVGLAVWFDVGLLLFKAKDWLAEVRQYQEMAIPTSSGQRLEMWKASVDAIAAAPVFGHGTGSVRTIFERAGLMHSGVELASNSHNQILHVGVQFGAVGILVLLAMWFSHARVFLGPGLVRQVGLTIVAQNFLSSLVNSHLSDFAPGWTYVIGVGTLMGMLLAQESGRTVASATIDEQACAPPGSPGNVAAGPPTRRPA